MTASEQPVVYVLIEGEWPNDVGGSLVTADGEALWSHVSSNRSWLERDLTSAGDRRAQLALRYPDGFTVKFVEPGTETPWGMGEVS